ncbi:hypothetical protein BHE74_00059689 [Ensete ventricosum]|nr:hypothetical protein BHE74_00059689 [Ensete ventricosum]
MSDLGHQDPDKEMKARWRGLNNSMKIWNDSSATEEFKRGLLHPQLARELYTLPSEVLLARAAKEMVLLSVSTKGKTVWVRPKRIIPRASIGRTNVRPTKMSLIILALLLAPKC